MAAGVIVPLLPALIEGGFSLGDKALSGVGRNKEAAGVLLRVQEADLRAIADSIDAMVRGKDPVNKEVLGLLGQLVSRSADIADRAGDILIGDQGK